MYCNNCGLEGHLFRSCSLPVISCGIILLRGIFEPLVLPCDPKELSVLMVRRKVSMCFMEFVRGKFETGDKEYIHRLIENMTSQEQMLIVRNDFETLWSKLWGNSRDRNSAEFEIAESKFNSIDKSTILCDTGSFNEAEWGFPKGRRSRGETDLQCAVREFNEETNIPEEAYKIIPNLEFTEVFTALNNIRYKHIYFVACLKSSKFIDTSKKMTPMQSREISAVEWKTLKEATSITRPHYTERITMIEELSRKVSIYETLADKQ